MAAAAAAGALAGRLEVRLLALLFLPYAAAHALFQQSHTLRYAMPYVPALALLAAAGIAALARGAGARASRPLAAVLGAAAAAGCAAVALPALAGYASMDAPGAAAMRAAGRLAPEGAALSGHYMFQRYFALAPPALGPLPPRARAEMDVLAAFWRAGRREPILFVAEPRRTDLESIDPKARTLRGRWAWPPATARLLNGERPDAADLVEIRLPDWFAGPGWGVTLERASPDGPMAAERTAWLRPAAGGILLVAGGPTDAAAGDFECALTLGATPLDARPCGEPWLAAYPIAPGGGGYAPVTFATRRNGVLAPAPFALTGLAYGTPRDAMAVHGPGWHYPETTRDGHAFRWASSSTRSLASVPPRGGRIVVEGEVPPRHVALPVTVAMESGGRSVRVLADGRFRLELEADPGPPREVTLAADREFVPDDVQRNGDRRRLALKVYSFEVSGR
jgi:hypothetical protein